jgi:TrmH family RNA methyltransferase
MSLNNIRIVLIETSHPGNIGSAARAMLTMGLTDLYLVKPVHHPNEQSVAMSSGATKVLDQAKIVDSLQEAIADCHRVIGTSARDQRSVQWPLMDARTCGEFIAEQSTESKTAIVFGRESSGLTNEELELCQFLVSIPVNPDFSSLNIASAVQVLSYECKMASNLVPQSNANSSENPLLATMDEMEAFYQHLQTTLIKIRYLDAKEPRLLMRKLRCLYGRIQMTRQELGILRGVLSATLGSKFIPRSQRD